MDLVLSLAGTLESQNQKEDLYDLNLNLNLNLNLK